MLYISVLYCKFTFLRFMLSFTQYSCAVKTIISKKRNGEYWLTNFERYLKNFTQYNSFHIVCKIQNIFRQSRFLSHPLHHYQTQAAVFKTSAVTVLVWNINTSLALISDEPDYSVIINVNPYQLDIWHDTLILWFTSQLGPR